MKCPPEATEADVAIAEKYALAVEKAARASFVYKAFDICDVGDILVGDDIKRHLEGCGTVILFAATLGHSVDALIRREAALGAAGALAADAAASACIEGFCRECDRVIAKAFAGKFLTFRYGAGYGDMPLSCQRKILEKINAEKRLGITLTESDMMLPMKSVSAVIGVSDTALGEDVSGCAVCALRETCEYRKKGESCGL